LKIGVFDTIGAPGFDGTPPKILPNLFLKFLKWPLILKLKKS
jgi:hypothetical protein